jgi:thiamine-phosphate pyrophosphorylase
MTALPRLYAIADAAFGDPVRIAEALFRGGARLVQLRNKEASARELLAQAEAIQKIAPPDARVIVNDRADVAMIAKAAGVHLGQTDMPGGSVRAIAGPSFIIGVSTHNMAQAMLANDSAVDYIAAGPVFPTRSKANPDPVLGIPGLRQICLRVPKPVVAIGGITIEMAQEVLSQGAASVAVISDILGCQDIAGRTSEWVRRCGEA